MEITILTNIPYDQLWRNELSTFSLLFFSFFSFLFGRLTSDLWRVIVEIIHLSVKYNGTTYLKNGPKISDLQVSSQEMPVFQN